MRLVILLMFLSGCSVPDYCNFLPTTSVTVKVVPNLEISGVPVYGHWRSSDRLIRVRPEGLHSFPHEMLHAGMYDKGIPKHDHHRLMEKCNE